MSQAQVAGGIDETGGQGETSQSDEGAVGSSYVHERQLGFATGPSLAARNLTSVSENARCR